MRIMFVMLGERRLNKVFMACSRIGQPPFETDALAPSVGRWLVLCSRASLTGFARELADDYLACNAASSSRAASAWTWKTNGVRQLVAIRRRRRCQRLSCRQLPTIIGAGVAQASPVVRAILQASQTFGRFKCPSFSGFSVFPSPSSCC
jgi:hypothetical protein